MKNYIVRVFCGMALLMGLFAGCGDHSSSEGETAEATQSRPIVYARGSDSPTLDPHNTSDGESGKVIEQMFETLVTFPEEAGGNLQPLLAKEWNFNEAGDVCTFNLRKNVTFHDGTAFDADAVVKNFDRILNPGEYQIKAPYASFYKNIDDVEAVDTHTVRFYLKEPSAVFLRNIAMFAASIVSPEALEKYGDQLGSNPVGTGPFQLRSWSRGEKIVLERYQDYWGEKSASRHVVFIPVKEQRIRLQKLKNGEADIIDNINVNLIDEVKKDSDLQLLQKPGMNFGYLAMNTLKEPLDHPKVRKAIALGVDRNEILEVVYRDVADLATTPIPPTVWSHHDGLEPYQYQPEKAKQLLKESGIDLDTPLTFLHMNNSRPYMPKPAEIARKIETDLEEIGFQNVSLEPKPWSKYVQLVENGEHDFCLLGWTTDNGDPDNFLGALFHSRNAKKGSALNVSFFRNDRFDQLVDGAASTLDREQRKQKYQKAQEILHNQIPILPLGYMPVLSASTKEIRGYEVYSIGMVRLWDAHLQSEP